MGASYFKEKVETNVECLYGESYDPFVNNGSSLIKVIPSCSAAGCCSTSQMRREEQTCTFPRVFVRGEPSKISDPVYLFESAIEKQDGCYQASSKRQTGLDFLRISNGNRWWQDSWTDQDFNDPRICGINVGSYFSDFETSESNCFDSATVEHVVSEKPQLDQGSSISWRTETLTYKPLPVTEIIPGKLYLGSEDNASNDAELLALGITHILSVSNRINRIEGLAHEHFVMSDLGRTELDTVLAEVYPFMKNSQQIGKKLFVHCKLGQNRSPTLVISFLIKNHGLTLYEAYTKLKKQRPLIQIHRNYAKMLLKLERNLLGETSLPESWMEKDGFNKVDGVPRYKSENLKPEQQQTFKINQDKRSAHSSNISVSLRNF